MLSLYSRSINGSHRCRPCGIKATIISALPTATYGYVGDPKINEDNTSIQILMKKHIFSILALVLVAQIAWAEIPANYYTAVDNKKSADAILDALFSCIKGHTVISYNALEDYYEDIDFRDDGTVWDMYSTCEFTMAQANHTQKAVCDGWNKEHSIPQSWFGEKSPMKSDLFHVYPTDARVNNFRSNYPYGECAGANGTGITNDPQNHALGKKGSNTFSGYTGTVFEPVDEYKGDFARTYFYMVARYRDQALNSSEGSAVFTANKTNLTTFATNLFLKWHRNDPVSTKEINRNNAVYKVQKNRNPFIDYPYLAEYIWGEKAGETVDMSKLIASCEEGFIPGQSNGWRDGSTPVVPPTPVKKYGVTWVVNGTVLAIDSVPENTKPAALPDEPTSCSETSESFYGWAGGSWAGVLPDYLPMDIIEFSNIDYMPNVVCDVTYHAVFAHKGTSGSAAPATYTYDADHKDGWTNTGTWTNNSYWLLDQGKALTSPEVDLSGLTSIQVKMRTYGGTSYDKFSVAAGNKVITTIEATKGSSMTDYEWTNTGSLTGASALTFTCSNAASSKGIGFQSVTINATGAGTVYENFITDCQGTTDAVNTHAEAPASKVLIGGQIYIFVGDALYTITGQKVQGR